MDLKQFYERLQHLYEYVNELSEDVEDSDDEIVNSYFQDIDCLLFNVNDTLQSFKTFHKQDLKDIGIESL